MGRKTDSAPETLLAGNRAAAHEYHLLRRFEAGLVLTGPEVKAARAARVNLKEGYVRVRRGEAFLLGVHISPYEHARSVECDPTRPRKLLLHAHELRRLEKETASEGTTIVPVRLYLKGGRIKVEIALARGKKAHDKRDAKRRRDEEREMQRYRD